MTQLSKERVVFLPWVTAQQTAFNKVKELLQSHQVFVHYDQKKEVILSTDVSAYGVGPVLSHIIEDGSEQHIAYYSRWMSSAETRYSTLDKEALAIVCGVKRIYQYLFGRKFIITTDHKPLLGLFGTYTLIVLVITFQTRALRFVKLTVPLCIMSRLLLLVLCE